MENLEDLRKLKEIDLNEKIKNYRKESLNLRFQKSSGQLENTARISVVKKEIARLKTLINEMRKA
jgi:large subunit ribosomal protein L29